MFKLNSRKDANGFRIQQFMLYLTGRIKNKSWLKVALQLCDISIEIEYEIIGEGSQISTNQKRESTVSWLLIGRNLRPFPDNFVLYTLKKSVHSI